MIIINYIILSPIVISLKVCYSRLNYMYPLIILGAGASIDYLRADDHIEDRDRNYLRYKAPLMYQLFDDRRFFEIINRYPRMKSFATDVMNAMSRSNPNFEDYLTNARDNL